MKKSFKQNLKNIGKHLERKFNAFEPYLSKNRYDKWIWACDAILFVALLICGIAKYGVYFAISHIFIPIIVVILFFIVCHIVLSFLATRVDGNTKPRGGERDKPVLIIDRKRLQEIFSKKLSSEQFNLMINLLATDCSGKWAKREYGVFIFQFSYPEKFEYISEQYLKTDNMGNTPKSLNFSQVNLAFHRAIGIETPSSNGKTYYDVAISDRVNNFIDKIFS